MIHDVGWLQQRRGWPALRSIVIVEGRREMPAPIRKIEREARLYITCLTLPARQLGPIIRGHGAIEKSLHGVMDMTLRDDECRVRTEHAPANFTTIKHIARNPIRRASGKDPMRLRRKVAAWDDACLATPIAACDVHPIALEEPAMSVDREAHAALASRPTDARRYALRRGAS